jgi:hypothetical protein
VRLIAVAAPYFPAGTILLGWILITPVAASLTNSNEVPHALRSLAGVPGFVLVIAFGLVEGLRRALPQRRGLTVRDGIQRTLPHGRASALREGRLRIALLAAFVAVEFASAAFFFYHYFTTYPIESQQNWQAGFGEALAFAKGRSAPGGQIWVTGSLGYPDGTPLVSQGEVLVAFHERIDPRQFQARRLAGTPFRVLPQMSDLTSLLTQAKGANILLIAHVVEAPGFRPLAVFADRPNSLLAIGVYRF